MVTSPFRTVARQFFVRKGRAGQSAAWDEPVACHAKVREREGSVGLMFRRIVSLVNSSRLTGLRDKPNEGKLFPV